MAADFFELRDDGLVLLKVEAKQVPEIKALIDKHIKDKDQLSKEIQYIWHMTSSRSPYDGYSPEKRESQVTKDFIKNEKWKCSSEVTAVMNLYVEINDSASKRLLRGAKNSAEQLAKLLNAMDAFSEDNKDFTVRALEKAGKIIESLDKLEERVKKEITTEEKVRGGGSTKNRER